MLASAHPVEGKAKNINPVALRHLGSLHRHSSLSSIDNSRGLPKGGGPFQNFFAVCTCHAFWPLTGFDKNPEKTALFLATYSFDSPKLDSILCQII